MELAAILLLGAPRESAADSSESVLGAPVAAVDVLGKPVACRVAERLRQQGVSRVVIVADAAAGPAGNLRQYAANGTQFVAAECSAFWRECERVFEDLTDSGAELVLVWRLGAYAELDIEALQQSHLDQAARITQVCDPEGEPLDIFLLCGSRRNDAAYLFRHRLRGSRMPNCSYTFHGYVNRLRGAHDLRRLTVDALLFRIALRPVGREVRPGIWIGTGARIQRDARLVAPCYVGPFARVRAAAVITRASSIEHHAEVDCGTIVEAATVLPFTYAGAGLDVCYSVVGFRKLASLRHSLELEVPDAKLIGSLSEHAPVRALSSLGSLFAFLPMQLVRGVFGERKITADADLGNLSSPSAALLAQRGRGGALAAPATAHSEFPSSLAIVRRYGNE
ncbi:MAG: hypothetical protein JO041_16610 [Acidobacteria bacterium]|nr:hypothetical protein [Acidobacteriota bacterium]